MDFLFAFEHAIDTVKWTHHVRDKLDSMVADEGSILWLVMFVTE